MYHSYPEQPESMPPKFSSKVTHFWSFSFFSTTGIEIDVLWEEQHVQIFGLATIINCGPPVQGKLLTNPDQVQHPWSLAPKSMTGGDEFGWLRF